MPAATNPALQIANPQLGTVSRQPQTTAINTAGAPFVRLSRDAKAVGFKVTSAFGGVIQQGINAKGGYFKHLILTVAATGGTSTAAVVAAADAPWSVIQTLSVSDSFGQPIIFCDGFGLYLINKYSGQCGQGLQSDVKNLASYSAIQTASGTGAGNWSFKIFIPFELDAAGYCSLVSMNASATPNINIQLAASSAVYTTAPTTLPNVITVTMRPNFWAAPIEDTSIAPPDVGATAQWSMAPGPEGVASGAQTFVHIPNVGRWFHTLILVLRDSANVRQDYYPLNDLTLTLDGVPIYVEEFADRVDDMQRMTLGISRDTGVIAYTFRQSVETIIGNADTHDVMLPTTPATDLTIGGTFQSVASAPATITGYAGQLAPKNAQGVPYTHLAQ
jgi:hypothetical protein